MSEEKDYGELILEKLDELFKTLTPKQQEEVKEKLNDTGSTGNAGTDAGSGQSTENAEKDTEPEERHWLFRKRAKR